MRCPVCRAANDQGPQCRRCRADLGLLFALEKQRRRALDAAYHLLTRNHVRRAGAIADGVRAMREDAEVVRLGAACALLSRDFRTALREALAAPGKPDG